MRLRRQSQHRYSAYIRILHSTIDDREFHVACRTVHRQLKYVNSVDIPREAENWTVLCALTLTPEHKTSWLADGHCHRHHYCHYCHHCHRHHYSYYCHCQHCRQYCRHCQCHHTDTIATVVLIATVVATIACMCTVVEPLYSARTCTHADMQSWPWTNSFVNCFSSGNVQHSTAQQRASQRSVCVNAPTQRSVFPDGHPSKY